MDRSHDGIASHDETYALAAQGVHAISLSFTVAADSEARDRSGNLHRLQGTFTQRVVDEHGKRLDTRRASDVYFRVRTP